MYLIGFILINILLLSHHCINSEVIFQETFYDESYKTRWVESKFHGSSHGSFVLSPGEHYGDYWMHQGLQTAENKRYYGISAKFDQPFSNRESDLVVQFQVKFEKFVQCGGGYIKVLSKDFDQSNFGGDTPYKIMFGPDMCGDKTEDIKVILNYKDKYYSIDKNLRCKMDRFSHIYTLVIRPNNTYTVLVDNEVQADGSIETDFKILPDKVIEDPDAEQPKDWVSEKYMRDPTEKKPESWDDRKEIPDPSAKKPEYWDNEVDGAWEAPLIPNPNYRGDWKPTLIENSRYKGPWKKPKIPNPKYVPDPFIYLYEDLGGVGFDLWQVKAGSIFDNILITNSHEQAIEISHEEWKKQLEEEQEAYRHKRNSLRQQNEEFKRLDAERRRQAQKIPVEDSIVNEESMDSHNEL